MKDEERYIFPRTMDSVMDQIGDIFNRANKLIEEIDYLQELCDKNAIAMKWKSRIKKYNPEGVKKFMNKYDIDEYVNSLDSLTDAMQDASDLINTEFLRAEKEFQKQQEEEED